MNTKYSNTELLNQFNLPVIHNITELSYKIGLSEREIYLLSMNSDNFYVPFKIPKKDGSKRKIVCPKKHMKLVQKWILVNLLENLFVSDRAKAFKKNINGIKENANAHKERLYILQLDMENFFPSIKRDRIYKLFRKKGYNGIVSGTLANLCTYDKYLPQGGVCSPILSNLVCMPMDKRLIGLCDKRDVIYTRYADDMTFSSNDKILLKKLRPIIEEIIQSEGFNINKNKTRFLSPKSRKSITGVNINSKEVKADGKLKRKVRAMIHKSIMTGNYEQNDKIIGMVAFIDSIEDNYRLKVIDYINNFEDKLQMPMDSKYIELFNKNKIFKEVKDFKYFDFDFDIGDFV